MGGRGGASTTPSQPPGPPRSIAVRGRCLRKDAVMKPGPEASVAQAVRFSVSCLRAELSICLSTCLSLLSPFISLVHVFITPHSPPPLFLPPLFSPLLPLPQLQQMCAMHAYTPSDSCMRAGKRLSLPLGRPGSGSDSVGDRGGGRGGRGGASLCCCYQYRSRASPALAGHCSGRRTTRRLGQEV